MFIKIETYEEMLELVQNDLSKGDNIIIHSAYDRDHEIYGAFQEVYFNEGEDVHYVLVKTTENYFIVCGLDEMSMLECPNKELYVDNWVNAKAVVRLVNVGNAVKGFLLALLVMFIISILS